RVFHRFQRNLLARANGGAAHRCEYRQAQIGSLLAFGCLACTPSEERGGCLLTKFGLAQFTARLFWRFGEQRHPAVNILDALPPHAVAARYTRPIRTHHNATPLNISKAAGCHGKPGGLAVVPQTMPNDLPGAVASSLGGVEPGRMVKPRGPTPQSYTRASLL